MSPAFIAATADRMVATASTSGTMKLLLHAVPLVVAADHVGQRFSNVLSIWCYLCEIILLCEKTGAARCGQRHQGRFVGGVLGPPPRDAGPRRAHDLLVP